MPNKCYFNVISFGKKNTSIFPECVEYNSTNLKIAKDAVDKFSANMGTTELLAPLQQIFKER